MVYNAEGTAAVAIPFENVLELLSQTSNESVLTV
jgi:hypothetical protein